MSWRPPTALLAGGARVGGVTSDCPADVLITLQQVLNTSRCCFPRFRLHSRTHGQGALQRPTAPPSQRRWPGEVLFLSLLVVQKVTASGSPQTPPHHVGPRAAAAFLFGTPAGPEWRRGGGPSVPSPATWLPRGGGGVEGTGAEEEGQREKDSSLLFFLLVSLLLSSRPPFPSSSSLSGSSRSSPVSKAAGSTRAFSGVPQRPTSGSPLPPSALQHACPPLNRPLRGSPAEYGSFCRACSGFERFRLRGRLQQA